MIRKINFMYNLFSFEFLFVCFLFAGRYKNDPRFDWVPIDLTALFFTLSVIAGIFVWFRNGLKIKKNTLVLGIIYIIFVLYALFSLIWTPGCVYANLKLFYMASLVLWFLMGAAIIIAQSRERIRRFFVNFIIFLFWIAFESTLAFIESQRVGFINALGGNYLGIGRVLGVGALIVLIYLMFSAKNKWQKYFALMVFVYFMWILLNAGGRGPFLSTILACFVPLFLGWSYSIEKGLRIKRYTNQFIVLISVLIIALLALYFSGNLTTTIKRMLVLFEEGMGTSAGLRISYYINSFNLWMKRPILGHGIGSWPLLYFGLDVRGYPHNIVLEIMVELGFVGLTIFVLLIMYALKCLGTWRTIRDDPTKILILMIFVNALINAMVSGDIPDNKFLFFILGMMTLTNKQ